MKRNEVLDKYKVKETHFFESEIEFNNSYTQITDLIKEISTYKNKVHNNVLKVLNLDEEISINLEHIYVYSSMFNDFDLGNDHYQKTFGIIKNLYNLYLSSTSFIIPEILDLNIDKLLEDESLFKFKNYLLEIKRLKKYTLNKDLEQLLSNISPTFRIPNDIFSVLTDVNLQFSDILDDNNKPHKLNNSNYSTFLESNDRTLRKNAFDSLYEGYKSMNETLAISLSSNVKNNNILSKLRGFNSSLEKSLYYENSNEIIYNTLLNSINNNLNAIYGEVKSRKKMLKISDYSMYDLYAPLIKKEHKDYKYEEAKDLVKNSLNILGKEYNNELNKMFDNNLIDVYPNSNKRSGAYCTCSYKSNPFVLLNYENKLNDVYTLTHELGHAIHYYFAKEYNTYHNYHYKIFVAEVASLVNEFLLSDYLAKNSENKKDLIRILDSNVKRFKSTVLRQTMFSEFEKTIHEMDQSNIILTNELLNEEYYKLNQKYFGEGIIIDDYIKYEWSRIPHFYYDFYVYKYATGYIAAYAIANNILLKKENALEAYIEFLKVGNKLDPVESLKVAGVDIQDEEIYNNAFKKFEKDYKELERMLNEQ